MTAQELQEAAQTALASMIQSLGYDATIEPVEAENGALTLNLKMDDAGRLIGRKGQVLEALELLLNRILKRQDETAPWVSVEIDGYSTGHTAGEHRAGGAHLDSEEAERFEHLALDAAKEVRHWKQEKRLGPYLPAERRIIHTALKGDPEVTTESIEAPEAGPRMKYVIVKPV